MSERKYISMYHHFYVREEIEMIDMIGRKINVLKEIKSESGTKEKVCPKYIKVGN